MSIEKFIEVVKKLLQNPYVIVTVIACLLMMNFAVYLCKYRKKPPKMTVRQSFSAKAPASDETSSEGGEDDGGDDEE